MPELNQVDRAAFAAENAAVTRQIEDLAANRWLQTNAPQLAKIEDFVNQLAHEGGMPRAAAVIVARRIVELESKLAGLQNEIDRQPAHMQGVERR